MQFNVAQLLLEPIGATRTYDLVEDLGELDPDLEISGPLVGRLQIMRIHSGTLVTGTLTTGVQVSCNRAGALLAGREFPPSDRCHNRTLFPPR